jgi:hypothetical protein
MKRPVPAESAFALIDERSTNLGTGAGSTRESARNHNHLGAAVAGRIRSAPISYAVRRPFPCSGCWTTGAGPVVDSTVRAQRG